VNKSIYSKSRKECTKINTAEIGTTQQFLVKVFRIEFELSIRNIVSARPTEKNPFIVLYKAGRL
jgi:hypothetical protein